MDRWGLGQRGPGWLLVGVLALAGSVSAARPVAACLLPVGAASPLATSISQRALLAGGDGTARLVLQTTCPSGAATSGGCWLVPVPGTVTATATGPDEPLTLLDELTGPHWVDDPGASIEGCPAGFGEQDGATSEGGRRNWDRRPASWTLVTLRTPAAALDWLAGQGCATAPVEESLGQQAAWAGWEFVGAHLAALGAGPGGGRATTGQPPPLAPAESLVVDYVPGSSRFSLGLYPLTSGKLDLTLWLRDQHRVVAADRPTVALDPPTHLGGDIFETLYEQWLVRQLAAGGAGAVATEFAAPVDQAPGLAAALAALALPTPAAGRGAMLTRLRTLLPAAELHGALALQPAPDDEPTRVRVLYGAQPPSGGGAGGPTLPLGAGLVVLAGLLALRRARPGRPPRSVRPRRLATAGLAAVLWLALGPSGCLPVGELRSARIQPEDEWRWSAGLVPARDPRYDLGREPPVPRTTTSARGTLPAVGGSYGLGHDYDVGLLLFPIGARGALRRGLLHQRPDGAGVDLTVGLNVSAFFDPGLEERCAELAKDGPDPVVDGCFEELRWGGLAEIPLTISQQVTGGLQWYTGVKIGLLAAASRLTYVEPEGLFADLRLDKQSWRGTAGLYFGTELALGRGWSLAGELQVLSSINEVQRVVYYIVPGLAVHWRSVDRAPSRPPRSLELGPEEG